MAYLLQGLFGERSLTKVAGLYPQKGQAESSMAAVMRLGSLQPGQVRLLGPHDARAPHREIFSYAMEPEPQGIARTFYQTHLVGGMAGAAAGLALCAWFWRAGQPMIASSPSQGIGALDMLGASTPHPLIDRSDRERAIFPHRLNWGKKCLTADRVTNPLLICSPTKYIKSK